MKVEDMQSIWTEMSEELEKQKKLTHEIIMQMTQQRYKSKLQKISNYEGTGAVLCFIIGIGLLANLNKLDTWYEMICGVFTVGFLLVYPFLSLGSIRAMKRINIIEGKYTDTLKAFTKARNNFLLVQRIGIALGFILIITILPVATRILKGKDLFQATGVWIWYTPMIVVLAILVSRWGYRHYKRITKSAGNILSELEEQE